MKSKEQALLSFILGLVSWVPLLNFGIAPLAAYFGVRAIKRIRAEPDKYGGFWFALIGAIIGIIVTFLSYSWLVLKLMREI